MALACAPAGQRAGQRRDAATRRDLPLAVRARRIGLKEPRLAVDLEADDERRNAKRPHAAALRVFLPRARSVCVCVC